MNKARLEAFSDGVFSIVMTLLIFDIKVPVIPGPATEGALIKALLELAPHIFVFLATFAVLSVAWINHHFLFHSFAKGVDRWLNLLNLLYLMIIVFVPFSASFLSTYYGFRLPELVFGINLLLMVLVSVGMLAYIVHSHDLQEDISKRILKQARFRAVLSIVSYMIGLIVSFFALGYALIFFVFPILFNIIPGTLNLTEKLFGLNFDM